MPAEFQVLARKYRPQRFQDLVGQEALSRTLKNAVTSGRIAHAFLFTGIRGVGKTTAARLLARALNCEKSDGPTPEPCADPAAKSACSNCREIASSSSVDVAEIDGASNRGIDSIRELTESVRYAPAKCRYRVFIIDEAHMVTREGFNALLKTLEEPPPHVKFIFATTAIDKFPDTIVSRCQRYDFKRIPFTKIAAHLRELAEKEGVKIEETALFQVARESEGSMRDAESLLDRLIAFAGKKIDAAQATEILGIADRRLVFEAADAALASDARAALGVVDRLYESSADLERFTRDLLEHWRNLVVVKVAGGPDLLRDLPEEEKSELVRQAGLRSLADLQRLFRVIFRGEAELRSASDPRLVLEMLAVRQATLEPALGVEEALERLEDIEARLGGGGGRPGPSGGPRPRTEPAPRPAPERPAPREPQRSAPSDPAPVAEASAEPAPKPSRPAADGASAAGWEDFLRFVQERRLTLYLNLMQARPLECRAGGVVLAVARDTHFQRELSRRENLEMLATLAGEHFGAPTPVRVEAADAAVEDTREDLNDEVRSDPAVQQAVNILGGAVREVRDARRR